MVEIVKADIPHACALLTRVRLADREEFAAFSGHTPAKVLEMGLRASSPAYAGLINGRVMTLFGVAPRSLLTGSGVPWLVGAQELERHQVVFLRRCRPILAQFLNLYPHLENYVDARNTVAIRWLRWLGFTLHEARPVGLAGLPFHRFEIRRGEPCADH